MPNKSISQLSAGGAVSGTDLFPDVQTVGVGPVKVTAAQLATYFWTSPTFTGSLLIPAGSSAAPSLAFSGSTNTGLFFPAANTLAFSTAGSERMRIDSAGNVGIGSSSLTGVNLRIGSNATGATVAYGVLQQQTIQPDVTAAFYGQYASFSTAATAFTVPSLIYYSAAQGSFGAGSTVTSQYGFFVANSLTGATNNYGFFSNIASGSGRWNFYANGTANNYFAGNVGVGATSFGSSAVSVVSIGTGTAPTTGPADTIQLYSTDLSAGNTMLSLYTEGTPVNVNATAAATHRIAIRVNGTVYYLLANTSA